LHEPALGTKALLAVCQDIDASVCSVQGLSAVALLFLLEIAVSELNGSFSVV